MQRATSNLSAAIGKRIPVNARIPTAPEDVGEVDIETLRPRVAALSPNSLVNIALEYLGTLDADQQEEIIAEYENAPEEEPTEEVAVEEMPVEEPVEA